MTKFTIEHGCYRFGNVGESINSIAKSLKKSTEVITFWMISLSCLEALKKNYTSFSLEDKLNIINYTNENGEVVLGPMK
ncbi:hypothetical protein ACQKKK_25900 [Peribacillus sp. NPDC006672]|uniref:hypothetical protein n=1 Tax=Peribacillus sp. NPDC006672 TaxID=3390606 RepID=UPI003CFC10AD